MIGCIFKTRNTQYYFSRFSKFDGITYEVSENLLQANWIPPKGYRITITQAINELQLFFIGVFRKDFHHIFNTLAQIEVDIFQLEFTGFDFRKIQNVVDN